CPPPSVLLLAFGGLPRHARPRPGPSRRTGSIWKSKAPRYRRILRPRLGRLRRNADRSFRETRDPGFSWDWQSRTNSAEGSATVRRAIRKVDRFSRYQGAEARRQWQLAAATHLLSLAAGWYRLHQSRQRFTRSVRPGAA